MNEVYFISPHVNVRLSDSYRFAFDINVHHYDLG